MKKQKELSEDELKVILQHAISESEDFTSTKLAKERERVGDYYRGDLPKPMHKGDSSFVSRDVFEAVDSARATIGETFLAHQRIVFFKPEVSETVEEAQQATEYTRHIFFKQNPGEDIIYEVLTDGMMNRYSPAKVYYEEETTDMEYEFEAINDGELEEFVSGFQDYEFTEAETNPETNLHSGVVREIKTRRVVRVEAIPPEDFFVSSNSPSVKQSKYCVHKTAKTKSDLIESGFDKKKVNALSFEAASPKLNDYEKQSRFDSVGNALAGAAEYQESLKEIDVYEVYIKLDMDLSGVAKLWKITYAGSEILDKERISRIPFVCFVPIPRPHTFFGENFAANVIPIQNIQTILTRQIVNHAIMTNNARTMVLNGTVRTPSELLDNRFGGLVNVNRMDGIAPLPQGVLNPYVFSLMQNIDEKSESVTGISKLSQGLNKDAISTQNSQGMVEQLIGASQQRQKIMARRFGLFIRELWDLIYHTAIDYIEEDDYVSVTGKYVKVNPIRWKERSAASIELALGYGEQEKESAKFIELDQYLLNHPILSRGYSPDKAYATVTKGLSAKGIEDIETYLTPPDELPPSEPSEAETLQLEMLKAQIAYTNAQAIAMEKKADTDRMNAETQRDKAAHEIRVKDNHVKLDTAKLDHEIEIDFAELEAAKTAQKTSGIMSPN